MKEKNQIRKEKRRKERKQEALKMFNYEEYEKQHLIRLHDAAAKAIKENDPIYKNNLKRTVNKYINNHRHTKHINELQKLIYLYETI